MVIMLLRQSKVEEATLTDIYTELGSEMDQEAAIELLKQMEEQDLLRIEWNDSAVHLLC
jgi:Ca2+-binding EF-hand superfamily protein